MAAVVEPAKCRVALLAGGTSGEREISLASGKGAGEALREAGFIVQELDPAKKDHLKTLIEEPFDVAFLCLHGKGGEDGVLQGFLETIGLPYTGPGVWSSATAMNKAQSKLFYQREGIATAPYQYLKKGEGYSVQELALAMGGTCVVKPATEGSALGIYIVEGEEAIADAIERVFRKLTSLLSLRSIFKVPSSRLPCWGTGILSLCPSSRLFLKPTSMILNRNMRPAVRSISARHLSMRENQASNGRRCQRP